MSYILRIKKLQKKGVGDLMAQIIIKGSNKMRQEERELPRRQEFRSQIEDCYRIMQVEGKEHEIYVPACVQFKIRNFTEVNFQNLDAQVNGVLCVNFLVFTENKALQTFICERLYFNPEERQILKLNRRKKMDNRQAFNYVPVMFNKDDNIKLPTTRTLEFQIQSFMTDVYYEKSGKRIKGKRIYHILRKEFSIEIIKNGLWQNFLAPFDFIQLELAISLDHMDVAPFYPQKTEKEKAKEKRREIEQEEKERKERSSKTKEQIEKEQKEKLKKRREQEEEEEHRKRQKLLMDKNIRENIKIGDIKKICFNCLRIEEPFIKKTLNKDQRTQKMSPMIAYSSEEPFGKYDVVETELESYTHDQREFKEEESQQIFRKQLFEDLEPTQLHFKPFKYSVFKIPLFRYPIVDLMTIFIPLWLLSFISVYIYFQTAQIMNRIVNVAGLMIAYAAIQPIVRQNIPEATTITLVDILIYSNLLINILFLCKSIQIRDLSDDPPSLTLPIELTNSGYNRWTDGLFIASLVIAIINVLIVTVLIIRYLMHRNEYKAKPLPRSVFGISDDNNWTLTLLMERQFARYKEKIIYLN